MQILRSFGLIFMSSIFFILPLQAKPIEKVNKNPKTELKQAQQLVESVDIQGNRRLRDDDLLYYIKTRAGDTFSPQQLERDLKELLSLNFFDKTATRVLTEDGVRGGVNVIFEVKELPLIRDLRFEGAKAIQEVLGSSVIFFKEIVADAINAGTILRRATTCRTPNVNKLNSRTWRCIYNNRHKAIFFI